MVTSRLYVMLCPWWEAICLKYSSFHGDAFCHGCFWDNSMAHREDSKDYLQSWLCSLRDLEDAVAVINTSRYAHGQYLQCQGVNWVQAKRFFNSNSWGKKKSFLVSTFFKEYLFIYFKSKISVYWLHPTDIWDIMLRSVTNRGKKWVRRGFCSSE